MTAKVSNIIERLNSKSLESQTVQLALLGAIVLLAAILRFYKLGEWSFWIDEIFTIGRAQAHYSNFERTLNNIPPHTNWIPLSLLLISAAINALGVSEWSVRLVPAIIGVMSIPILYLPTRRILGTGVALISSLLLAVSPWHIMWSQNGRFYVALMLLSFLTLFTFYFGLERNRASYLIAGLFVFYLALSERMIAVFVMPVIVAYLILLFAFRFAKPPGLNRRNIIILALPVISGLLIEVSSFLISGNSRFFGDSDAFIGNAIDSPVRILILIFFSIGLPVIVLGTFTGGWLVWQRNRAGLFLALSAIVPIIVLVAVSPWVFVVERYALITLPAWLILTAVAIDRLMTWLPHHASWLAYSILIILIANAGGELLMYYQLNNGNRPDWRGAFKFVQANMGQDDMIASTWPEIGAFYLGTSENLISLKDNNPASLAHENKQIWFVVDSEAIWFAPGEHKQWMEDNAELLFVWYLRMREQIDLKVYRYKPSNLNH